MARAGEVIEEMQGKGELATQGGDRKSNSHVASLKDLLGDGAHNRASRYKTAAKARKHGIGVSSICGWRAGLSKRLRTRWGYQGSQSMTF